MMYIVMPNFEGKNVTVIARVFALKDDAIAAHKELTKKGQDVSIHAIYKRNKWGAPTNGAHVE